MLSKMASGWYSFWLFLGWLFCWLQCKCIHLLPGVDRNQKEEWSIFWTVFWFRVPIWLSPWIKIKNLTTKSEWKKLYDPVNCKGGMLLINHTSLFDPSLIIYLLPVSVLQKYRTIMKAELMKMPFFGTISECCGHFAVHFKFQEMGNFSVDKSAQKVITARMTEFIKKGGGIVVYPEGQVSKNPPILQDFRRGSFKFHLEHKLPMFCVLQTDVHISWPRAATFGGRPATIRAKLIKVPVDANITDVATISKKVRLFMQEELDALNKKKN